MNRDRASGGEWEVRYDLAAWVAGDRRHLGQVLHEKRVLFRWEGGELVVRADDEHLLDRLVDEMSHEEAGPPQQFPDLVIPVGEFEVVVQQVNTLRYDLASLLAWPIAFLSWDASGGFAPTKRYRVSVESVVDGERVWQERATGQYAFDRAEEVAKVIATIGIDDFRFRTERGWRIE